MNNLKNFFFLIAATLWLTSTFAQTNEEESNSEETAPVLEFVMQLRVTCGQGYSAGETPAGHRFIIPITGGTFSGPNINGEVLSGGADYQLQRKERTDLEAIYCIRTSDGVTIHVRNTGIISFASGICYFYTAPSFEAPENSPYAWLNHSLFVCRPAKEGIPNGVVLNVWKVK